MKKVLVIEDQDEVRENICEILELTGYEVRDASNGKLGCSEAVQWQPDLILCDVMMPELDGFGVLKILRKRPETKTIPLIFLTAKVEPEDLRKGMGLGADDYLMKPFDNTELLEAIDLRLRKRETEQERSLQYKSEMGNLRSADRERKTLLELLDTGEEITAEVGDELWHAGQPPRGLYYVKSGAVKVYRRHANGKVFMVNYVCAPSFLGLGPFFLQQPYTSWAEIDQPGHILFIAEEFVTQKMFEERDVAMHFMRLSIEHADDLEGRAMDYAYSSVRRRVARALLQLCRDSGLNGMPVSRDDLAALAGTAKETTIRTLSDFKSEGCISVDGRQIKILDAAALEQEEF